MTKKLFNSKFSSLSLSLLTAVCISSSTLFAQSFTEDPGKWSLVGSVAGLTLSTDTTLNDASKVAIVWTYDGTNGWKAYSPDSTISNTIPSTMKSTGATAIAAGSGFWVKWKDAVVSNGGGGSTTVVTIPFTADMIVGKTLYFVDETRYQQYSVTFGTDYKVLFRGDTVNYQVANGVLTIGDMPVKLVSNQTSYLSAYMQAPQTSEDDSGWFGSVYGASTIASFNNNITQLRDYFLSHGLWETTITAAGSIDRFDMTNQIVDGQWWIENNKFYFLYPDSDGLDDKAYWLENNKLMKATNGGIIRNIRMYSDQATATAYFNSLLK